jgi:sec-independent protein translocase protein TatA
MDRSDHAKVSGPPGKRRLVSRPAALLLKPRKEKNVGGFSAWHWIIVALVVLVLFGRGKISETMGDFGKGIKSFKKGLGEEDNRTPPTAPPPQQIAPPPSPAPEQAAPDPAPSDSTTKAD